MSGNPVFSCPGDSGDPFVFCENGTYYMTMTGGGGGSDTFVCRTSTDLEHWSEPAVILDLKRDTVWARTNAWAPTMVEQDGRYYFAFCADQQIGIAVGESPLGPFRDLLGHPFVRWEAFGNQSIDPCFFKDDDGKVYLFFGQGKLWAEEILLSPQGARWARPPKCLSDSFYAQCSKRNGHFDITVYNEAPDVVKIGDKYLLTWAIYDVADYRYATRYAWSRKVLGPYVQPKDCLHDNILIQPEGDLVCCGHGCIVEKDGRHYYFYGRYRADRTEPGRELCREEIDFSDPVHPVAHPTH